MEEQISEMEKLKMIKSPKAKGLTLIETAMALGVLAIGIVGLAQIIAANTAATRAHIVAEKMEQISVAAATYLDVNAKSLETYLAANPNATVTIPIAKLTSYGGAPSGTPGFQSLQDAGLLPPGFIDANPARQNHAVLVRRLPNGKLDSLLVAFSGDKMSDQDLVTVASSLGSSGGAVYDEITESPKTHIVGAFGGWSYPVGVWHGMLDSQSIAPTAGRPAVSLSMLGATYTGPEGSFLSRVATADPGDTTMTADLNMGGKTISNAGSIQASGTIGAGGQIDTQRYVWSREGLWTEGNVWSRGNITTEGAIGTRENVHVGTWLHSEGGIGTHGPIVVPRGNVNAKGFCDESGAICFTASQVAKLIAPIAPVCRLEAFTVSGCENAACPAGSSPSGQGWTGGHRSKPNGNSGNLTFLQCTRQVCN